MGVGGADRRFGRPAPRFPSDAGTTRQNRLAKSLHSVLRSPPRVAVPVPTSLAPPPKRSVQNVPQESAPVLPALVPPPKRSVNHVFHGSLPVEPVRSVPRLLGTTNGSVSGVGLLPSSGVTPCETSVVDPQLTKMRPGSTQLFPLSRLATGPAPPSPPVAPVPTAVALASPP